MSIDKVPSPRLVVAMASACPTTANGWLWYCDVHDTHGTANSQDEVEHVAQAHRDYHDRGGFDHRCNIVIWLRTEHERLADV